jgi:predicted CopG family antitoxin
MGTKNVRLDEDVYERIKSQKREDGTFSEAIDRLTNDYTLLDFAAEFADEDGTQWEADRALIESTEDEEDEVVERLLNDE